MTLLHKVELFRASAVITRDHEELFIEVCWRQALVGQGIEPESHHPLAHPVREREHAEYVQAIELLRRREVDRRPSRVAFIAKRCAAPAG